MCRKYHIQKQTLSQWLLYPIWTILDKAEFTDILANMSPEKDKTFTQFEKSPAFENPLAVLDYLTEIAINAGKRVDLVVFVNDLVTRNKNMYSLASQRANPKGPNFPSNEVNSALTQIIAKLSGDSNGRNELELGLKDKPDFTKNESHHDENIWLWPTTKDNLMLGIKEISDQHGISSKTWFVEMDKPKRQSKILNWFKAKKVDPSVY
jgi:arginyl-tRNA synthetase